MDTDSFDLDETYAGLVAGRATTMTIADTAAGTHTGSIAIDGEIVATADPAAGSFAPSGACAP